MKRKISSLIAIVAATLILSGPALSSVPSPVIRIGDADPPAYDPTEPYRDDRSGRCAAGNTRMSPGGVIDLTLPTEWNRLPGSTVPSTPASGGQSAPCLADVRLDLVIEAPKDKKPEGADGNLDGIAVPRSALEGGFEVTLPAQDRSINLSEPGENWELKSTSCSCSGWTTLTASAGPAVAAAPAERTSYPQPIMEKPAPPSGGPGGCSGSAPRVFSPVATRPVLPGLGGPSEVTAYPEPVISKNHLFFTQFQAPKVEWDADGAVTITDPDQVGGTFTCVWTVELIYGQLQVETVTKPEGQEGRFQYEVVPTGGQPDATAVTVRGSDSKRLRWGPWSVEMGELPEGWKVKKSNCTESDGPLVSLADGPSATVGLDQDDAVKCTFELELLAPKPGRWKANNKAGTVVCSKGGFSIPFDLDQAIDFGRLRVRDEGDTLIARGRGNRFTWRRDRDDPLRYAGTKRFKQAGFTLDFDIRLNLKSETRMTGTMRAKAKGRGAQCTARRSITLTHASAR